MHTARLHVLVMAAASLAALSASAQQPGSLPVMPGAHAPGAAADSPREIPVIQGPAIRVAVSIAPLEGLVRPLLPQGSTVTVLVPPGRSEHGYELAPAELAALARADLVVYVGLNLEPKIAAIVQRRELPDQRVVCFAQAAGVVSLESRDGTDHDHHAHQPVDDGVEHDHGGEACESHGHIDPHLWLDPSLCEKLVGEVAEQVKAIMAARNAPASTNGSVDLAAAALQAKVRDTDGAWKAALAPLQGRAIVTHHDAFSRPAERYGLKIAAVVRPIEAADPSPAQLAAVIEAIRKQHVQTLFVEPQFNPKAAERIGRAAGINIARLDPLGDGDWFKMMRENLDALTKGLATEK